MARRLGKDAGNKDGFVEDEEEGGCIVITKSDVWEAARKFGGVSVQYGETDVYEVIMQGDSRNKCCIVVSENGVVNDATKRIAKSISNKCFIVTNMKSLENVMKKTAEVNA